MDNVDMKICPSCGGIMNNKKTTYKLDFESSILIVNDVPTLICSTCDDKWYTDSVSHRLDEYMADALRTYSRFRDDPPYITRFADVA